MHIHRKGKPVYEARILTPDHLISVDRICHALREFCRLAPDQGPECTLNFGVGRALIRASLGQILIRVEADDVLACHSIKVALEGSIAGLANLNQSSVLWIATCAEPFQSLAEL